MFWNRTCLLLMTLLVSECSGIQSTGSRYSYVVKEDTKNLGVFGNYMHKDSYISITVLCSARSPEVVRVNFQWVLSEVACMEDMHATDELGDIPMLLAHPSDRPTIASPLDRMPSMESRSLEDASDNYRTVPYQTSIRQFYSCENHNLIEPKDESDEPYALMYIPESQNKSLEVIAKQRSDVTTSKDEDTEDKKYIYRVVKAWETGMYHFSFVLLPTNDSDEFDASVLLEFHGRHGFLSAIEFPLLPFNIIMALFYLTVATIWLVVWARSVLHSHKIHVVMGIISVAGAITHTLQFVEYATVSANGQGVTVIMWFARVVSVLQISLFSMLLMVVAVGYGITRPFLSRTLIILIISLGSMQFFTNFLWQVLSDKSLQINIPILTKVVLWMKAAIVVFIAGWVTVTAFSTGRHLRQGRHSEKITVFTVFVICCLVAFVGQLVMFGLSMGWMRACRQDWQLEWIFSSYDNMVDFFLLIMLMFLWRPVDAAQSYAFAPLRTELVEDDEEEDDELGLEESVKIPLEPLS